MTALLALFLTTLGAAQAAAEPDRASGPDLLEEARSRALLGDYEGARILATQALDRPGSHHGTARYLVALSWEYDGDPRRALALYDDLLGEWTDGEGHADLLFRRAEALGRLGRTRAAIRQLDALGPLADRPFADHLKVDLLRGIWQVERGRQRAGLAHLEGVLDDAFPTAAPYYQAWGRTVLLQASVDEAERIRFRGRTSRKGDQLVARASLVQESRDHLADIIPLESHAHTLEGLLAVGDAHVSFGQAILDESRPRRLTDDQRAIYERARAEKVEAVWVKAAMFYDRGVTYAEERALTGPRLDELRSAQASVLQRIEGLGG